MTVSAIFKQAKDLSDRDKQVLITRLEKSMQKEQDNWIRIWLLENVFKSKQTI